MSLHAFLEEHGLELALGATVLLSVGCLCVVGSKVPVHRKRLGELTAWSLLAFLILAAVPLPRLDPIPLSTVATGTDMEHGRAVEAWGDGPRDVVRGEMEVPTATSLPPSPEANPALVPDDPENGGAPLPVDPADVAEGSGWLDLYFLGGGLGLLYLLVGAVGLGTILLRAVPAPAWVDDLVPKVGKPPRILVTRRRCRPFCLGLGGRIVVPEALLEPQRQEALRLVLLHELAHVRQGDIGRQLPFALLLPVLFFHPLYWWLRVKTRLASEMLADDWAAQQTTKTHYARELIALAEEDALGGFTPLGMASVFGSPSEFYRRIAMLLERDSHLSARCSRRRNVLHGAGAVLLLASAVGMWGVPAPAQDPGGTRDTVRSLRQERDRLLEEITRLRAEMRARQPVRESLPGTSEDPSRVHREVVVTEGDTLRSLIVRYGHHLSWEQLLEANPDLDPQRLRVGQTLVFPSRAEASRDTPIEEEPEAEAPWRTDRFADRPVGIGNPVAEAPAIVADPVAEESAALGETAAEALAETEARDPYFGTLSNPFQSRGRDDYGSLERPILDSATLQLLTQAIDLVTELEGAREELDYTSKLMGNGFVTERDALQARLEVKKLTKKRELFLSLIQSEVESVEEELDLLKERRDQYAKDSQGYRLLQLQMQRAARRIQLLTSVL